MGRFQYQHVLIPTVGASLRIAPWTMPSVYAVINAKLVKLVCILGTSFNNNQQFLQGIKFSIVVQHLLFSLCLQFLASSTITTSTITEKTIKTSSATSKMTSTKIELFEVMTTTPGIKIVINLGFYYSLVYRTYSSQMFCVFASIPIQVYNQDHFQLKPLKTGINIP